jgi:ATP-dependent Clp protease ATP-binding subunit ClpC
MHRTPEQDLVRLRKQAEALAEQRGERPSTAHLLFVVAEEGGLAKGLLDERRIDGRAIAAALRVVTDDEADAVAKAVARAREFAGRQLRGVGPERGGTDPALVLLHALCQEQKSASYRFLQQVGVDIARLRSTVLQYATGVTAPRRVVEPQVTARPVLASPLRTPNTTALPPGPSAPTLGSAFPSARRAGSENASRLAPPASRPPQQLTLPKPAKRAARPTTKPLVGVSGSPVSHTAPVDTAPLEGPPSPPAAAATKPPVATKERATKGTGAFDAQRYPRLAAFATPAPADVLCLGRDRELGRLVELLHKKNGHHALVVGDAAVGKSTVLRALGQGLRAFCIDANALLAAAPARGQLTATLRDLEKEAEAFANGAPIVLLVDDAAALFTSEAEAETSAALRKLAAPQVSWVLALGTTESKRIGDRDPALLRQFGVVELGELDLETSIAAVKTLVGALAEHHRVTYEADALEDAVRWTARWVSEKRNPEKSLVLLDRAGARTKLLGRDTVTRAVVAKALSEDSKVPVERLLESDGERLLALENHVGKILVGHEAPLAKIADILRRNASGFRSGRPIGSFLLLGPTGVGKTECAKALAEVLFGSERAMTRIDLSEYSEPHSVARLFGAPPGYVGHEAGGQLTDAIGKRPYQLVLLDEVEKAHRDVLLAFLQVFDEGRLTDGRGRVVDFSNTVILLTSNLGADSYSKKRTSRVGFGAIGESADELDADRDAEVVAAARRALAPELYNRLDEVLVFAPLARASVREVARRMLAKTAASLFAEKGVELDVSDHAIDALLDLGGYDPSLGARPMRRTIAREVEARLANLVLGGQLKRGDVALLEASRGKIVVDVVRRDPATRSLSA